MAVEPRCGTLTAMKTPARNPHFGAPFDDERDAIERHLQDVSVPTLLCSMVHMTGDPSWIQEVTRPSPSAGITAQGLYGGGEPLPVPPEAVEVIRAYQRDGCEPKPLSDDVLTAMMEFLARTPLSERMRGMFFFDMQFDGVDPAAITWRDEIDEATRAESPVVVIGAGMAGIQAGIRLAQAGLPFTIVEKNAGAGGTWYENHYPGARVDVPSHQYCYAFEPGHHWSEYYCQHPELRAYFTHILDKYDLRAHTRFETEVTGAEWDEAAGRWRVGIRQADGRTEELEARFVISACGSLNIPKLPEIEGIESFAGPAFHSARWPEDFDHRGKRIALLGAGASGFQIAPAIADEVESLSIFQRTAQWVMQNPLYQHPVPEGEAWCMAHLPFYARWLRFTKTYPGIGNGVEPFRVDSDHVDPDNRSVNAGNAMSRDFMMGWMKELLDGRDDLIEKVLPDYPAMGKRLLQDDGSWFKALRRDNVELVRNSIARIEPGGIRTADGVLHEVDAICFATGFKHNDFLAFDLKGREGASLQAQWGDEPSAYLGISVPRFPNFFATYGPGTNLAHSAGLFFHAEYQTMHALQAIHHALAEGARSIEVRQEVHDCYVEELVEQISGLVWAHPSIQHSHYKNPHGRVYTLSPWSIDAYWDMCRELDPTDYTLG